MAFKLILLVACAVVASANAGLTVTSGSDNTYRTQGNLAQVSTQTKTIETPYSSSSKTDVRVSNPSVYVTAQPAVSYTAQPVHHHIYQSDNQEPKYGYAAAAAPAGFAYSGQTPAYVYAAAPAVRATYYPQEPTSYAAHPTGQIYAAAPEPVYAKTAYAAAPAAYRVAQPAQLPYYSAPAVYSHAAPAYNHAGYARHAAPVAPAHQPIVGVAYSPAAEVSHLTYSNVNDHINYSW